MGLTGTNIGGGFPPLGFKTIAGDIVRPRTIIVPELTNNGDGSITIPFVTTTNLNNTLMAYLKLNFSNLQSSPATNGFAINGNTLELWWNDQLVQSWTVTLGSSFILNEDGSFVLTEDGSKIIKE
jgi:hypothetical protein